MSREGPLPPGDSLLARPFALATRLILACPVAVVSLAVCLAVVALVYTGMELRYKTSRLDLLNPKSDYNRSWINYIEEFGDGDDAVVVVEGTGREQVVPVLEELSEAIARENRLFHAVLHEVDLGKIRVKGLHYLSPDELRGIEKFLSEVQPIVAGDWSRLQLGNMASGLSLGLADGSPASDFPSPSGRGQVRGSLGLAGESPPSQADRARARLHLERLTASLLETLSGRQRYTSPWTEMPQSLATLSELNSEYLLTKQGQLGFVLLRLTDQQGGFARSSEATDALRDLIASVQARYPETKIGLTGLPIMENDEMRSSQTSMFWASLLSFVGVACLFVAGFGGGRHALLANLMLLIGMAWSFGYLTLVVGHLNILSVCFTVTLIGIGIDYGVYYVSWYLQLRRQGIPCEEAILRTSSGAGPAIATGAVTTAVAFFAAGFTTFTGVAELGIIAGGGLLLCAIAELFVLPAALFLVDRGRLGQRLPEPLAIHKWLRPLQRMPRCSLAVTAGLTLFAALWLPRLWYDHNLLHMQAEGLESVKLEQKLLAECNQSVWYALSIAGSREELLERKARFLTLASVERTEEIVSLLPSDHEVKQPVIRRIQQRLAQLPERPALIPVDKPENLGRALRSVQELLTDTNHDKRFSRQLELVRDLLRRMPAADCYALISRFQQEMAGDLLSRLHALEAIADPEPPKLSDLPMGLVKRFVSKDRKHHLLKIYGKGNIWDTEALTRFVKEVRTVDPNVTGNPVQAHEASLEMKSSYEEAAIYAMLVIAAVLMFDFRDWRHALLAALPLGVGMLQMFGLLGMLEIPLNPANLIALPLILGIGVDYGVHIVHEFRQQRGPYSMSPGTAVAVAVDAATTIVGFGSLMIASHQGLQSLGRVLTLGVTCCLFNSVVMLPALLVWMTRHRPLIGPAADSSGTIGPVDLPRRRLDTVPPPHQVAA